jgi:hypothetical protein
MIVLTRNASLIAADHNVTDNRPLVQQRKTGQSVLQRQLGVRTGPDPPGIGEVPDRRPVLTPMLRKPSAIFSGADPDYREPFDQGNIRPQGREATRSKANHQQSTIEGDAPGRFAEHIAAVASGQLFYPVGETIGGVDQMIGAIGLEYRQFDVAGRGGNNRGAERLGKVQRR